MDAEPAAPVDSLDKLWQTAAQAAEGFDASANTAAFFGAAAPADEDAAVAYGVASWKECQCLSCRSRLVNIWPIGVR